MVSGNSMAHIYLRKDFNWEKKYTFIDSEKLIDSLLKINGIDLVMALNQKNHIIIKSDRGLAVLEEKENLLTKNFFSVKILPSLKNLKITF